jgi:hypothetical protein
LSPHQQAVAEIAAELGWQSALDEHGFLWVTKSDRVLLQIAPHVPLWIARNKQGEVVESGHGNMRALMGQEDRRACAGAAGGCTAKWARTSCDRTPGQAPIPAGLAGNRAPSGQRQSTELDMMPTTTRTGGSSD